MTRRNLIRLAAIAIILAGSVYTWLFHGPGLNVLSLSRYESTLRKWPTAQVGHFPRTLPSHATKKRFSAFRHGWGQGDTWVQLRLTLPPEDVRLAFEEGTQLAKQSYERWLCHHSHQSPGRRPLRHIIQNLRRWQTLVSGPLPDLHL